MEGAEAFTVVAGEPYVILDTLERYGHRQNTLIASQS